MRIIFRSKLLLVPIILFSSLILQSNTEDLLRTESVIITFNDFDPDALSTLKELPIRVTRIFGIIPTIVADVPVTLIPMIEQLQIVQSVEQNFLFFAKRFLYAMINSSNYNKNKIL